MTTARRAQVAQLERQRNAAIKLAEARRAEKSAATNLAEATNIRAIALAEADEATILVATIAAYIGKIAAKEVGSPKIAAEKAAKAAETAISLAITARQAANAVCLAEEKAVNSARTAREKANAAAVAYAALGRTGGADEQAARQVAESKEATLHAAEEVTNACTDVKNEARTITNALANASLVNAHNPIVETSSFNITYEKARDAILFLAGLGLTVAAIIETKLIDKIVNFINGSETIRSGIAATQLAVKKVEAGATLFATTTTSMAAAKLAFNVTQDQCGDAKPAYLAAALAGAAAVGAVQLMPLIRPGVSTVNATYSFTSKELKLSPEKAAFIATAMGVTVVGSTYFIPLVGQVALAVSASYTAYTGAHMIGDWGYYLTCADDIAKGAADKEIEGAWDWLDAPHYPIYQEAIANTATAKVKSNIEAAPDLTIKPDQPKQEDDAKRDCEKLSKPDDTNKVAMSLTNVEPSSNIMIHQQLLQDTTSSKKSLSNVSRINKANTVISNEVLTSRIIAHKQRLMKRTDTITTADSKKSLSNISRINKANTVISNEVLTSRIIAHKQRLMKKTDKTATADSKSSVSARRININQHRYFSQQKNSTGVNSSTQRQTYNQPCRLQPVIIKRN